MGALYEVKKIEKDCAGDKVVVLVQHLPKKEAMAAAYSFNHFSGSAYVKYCAVRMLPERK